MPNPLRPAARSAARRTLGFAAIATLSFAGLASCGGDDGEGAAAPAPTTVTGSTAAEAAFPATVEHKFGTTTVPAEPARVVTVEVGKEEYLLAVGAVPVGLVRSSSANFPDGVSPWAHEAMEAIDPSAEPTMLTFADGIDFEAVAGLDPDLIVGTEGLTDEEYATLSGIAPTIAQPEGFDDYSAPFEEQAKLVGAALGRSDEMDDAVAGVTARFDDAKAANPAFAGSTATFAGDFGDGTVWVFADYRGDFFRRLGLERPTTLTEDVLANPISAERLDVLSSDALVLARYGEDGSQSIEASPTFGALPMVGRGSVLTLDRRAAALSALNFSTPLSLPVALDAFVPALGALIDGDPATAAPSID